jgi:putative membrane protein
MKGLQVFAQDFKNFRKHPMSIITFLAVAFVPILYSGFLIKGTWDPYGNLENLPVAVVNMDTGASYQGKTMNVGDEFVQELKKNPKFAWKFIDESEAQKGIENNRYYAKIIIPKHFSEDAASLNSDHPHQAKIQYESNSYYNFIGGQISENAMKELRTKLATNVTEAYTRSVFQQFTKLSDGLQSAGDGASDLHDGADQLDKGTSLLASNVKKLNTGVVQIQANTKLLHRGSSKIAKGADDLNKGATALSNGSQQLADAGAQLEKGAENAEAGSKSLVTGIQASKRGTDQLTSGLSAALSGSKQLESGLTTASQSSKKLADGADQVSKGLQQMKVLHPELALDPNYQKLLEASQSVASGSKQLSEGQSKLLAGSKELTASQQKLLTGSQKVSQGNSQLVQGAKKLAAGNSQIASGLQQYNTKFTSVVSASEKLAKGAGQLNTGAVQLQDGLGQLYAGSGKIVSGVNQLSAGADRLETGTAKLNSGSLELATKLKDAAKQTADFKADDQTFQLFSTPVSIQSDDDRHISVYAYGIAPYFISLALFAGSLVFTTVFSARTSSSNKKAKGWKLFISKTLTFALMSFAQSLVASTILVYILDLQVQNVLLFYGFTALVGFTFMFFCQAMVTLFDQVGRFLILLVMIFQLASSAGTFPFELLPNWARALNPWLPMTYSIRGFRDIVSSGNYADLQGQVVPLLLFAVLFLSLTIGYFYFKKPSGRKPLTAAVQG